MAEFEKHFNTEIQKQKEANKGNKERQEKIQMDFVSIADPIPTPFDLKNDETDPDKSHFEYVFSYAMILFMELGEGCDEIKIEEVRPKAKQIVEKLISDSQKAASSALVQQDDDSEEEIITEKEEEVQENPAQIPRHEDVQLNAHFIDRLVDLREIIKKNPKSYDLIK